MGNVFGVPLNGEHFIGERFGPELRNSLQEVYPAGGADERRIMAGVLEFRRRFSEGEAPACAVVADSFEAYAFVGVSTMLGYFINNFPLLQIPPTHVLEVFNYTVFFYRQARFCADTIFGKDQFVMGRGRIYLCLTQMCRTLLGYWTAWQGAPNFSVQPIKSFIDIIRSKLYTGHQLFLTHMFNGTTLKYVKEYQEMHETLFKYAWNSYLDKIKNGAALIQKLQELLTFCEVQAIFHYPCLNNPHHQIPEQPNEFAAMGSYINYCVERLLTEENMEKVRWYNPEVPGVESFNSLATLASVMDLDDPQFLVESLLGKDLDGNGADLLLPAFPQNAFPAIPMPETDPDSGSYTDPDLQAWSLHRHFHFRFKAYENYNNYANLE